MNWSRDMMRLACCCLAITALGSFAARADKPVSMESLLTEMIDRDSVARYPEKNFRLKQHSSYNRASKTPEDAKGWFTNKDYNRRPKDENGPVQMAFTLPPEVTSTRKLEVSMGTVAGCVTASVAGVLVQIGISGSPSTFSS